MKKTIAIIFTSICLMSFVGCNGGPTEVIYEHEKLYEQYKQENPNDWIAMPQTELYEVQTKIGDNETHSDFYNQPKTLAENENYGVSVEYPVEKVESSNRVQTAPIINIYKNQPDEETEIKTSLIIEDGFYLYNTNGEEIGRIITGSHTPGYYDPYEKDKEPFCWYKTTENGIQFKFLAVEQFFVGNDYLPWAMNEEDYQYLTSMINENWSSSRISNWEFHVGDWTATETNLEILGLQSAVDREVFEAGIHVVKEGIDAPYKQFDTQLKFIGITIEEKRLIESRVIEENYAANMAMITLTLDISGEIPAMELTYEIISPKESDVESLYLSSKDVDYNEIFKEVFSK